MEKRGPKRRRDLEPIANRLGVAGFSGARGRDRREPVLGNPARSFIALKQCENCLSVADLAGLLGSVGVQKFPGPIPLAEIETDKTVAIKLPASRGIHYVIIPKKDLKDVSDISEANAAYLTDAYLVARRLIERDRLSNYRLYTNGPGIQNATYLHFHLVAQ